MQPEGRDRFPCSSVFPALGLSCLLTHSALWGQGLALIEAPLQWGDIFVGPQDAVVTQTRQDSEAKETGLGGMPRTDFLLLLTFPRLIANGLGAASHSSVGMNHPLFCVFSIIFLLFLLCPETRAAKEEQYIPSWPASLAPSPAPLFQMGQVDGKASQSPPRGGCTRIPEQATPRSWD